MLLSVQKADAWLKQYISCCFANSFDFALEKLQFSRLKSNELTVQQDMF